MAAGTDQGLGDAIRFDLKRMHETWMEVVYPRQRDAEETVLGKWTPDEGLQVYLYRLWSTLGVPVVAVLYPLVLFGYFVRFQTRRVNITAVRLGFLGVVLLFVLVWGLLSALVAFQLEAQVASGGVTAIVAASGVAVLSSALAYGFWALDGRPVTVLFAYPFAMTAVFLPPVVAALYSEAVAEVVLTRSDSLASWSLDQMPVLVEDYLVENFDRDSFAHVIIWFGVSIPVGWVLGIVVTLADLVRPTGD
ncbi:MAG: hypothetical protein ABEH61_03175 [Haloarculaceae archaeon]